MGRKIWAVIEPRSNTMKLGIYKEQLALSASLADGVIWYEPKGLSWELKEAIGHTNGQVVLDTIDEVLAFIKANVRSDDAIVVMSNGAFEGIHGRILDILA